MATKKATSTKKAPVRKAAAKTTVRTVRADAPKTESTPKVAAASASRAPKAALPKNIINVVLAELVGTFVLTLVMTNTFQDNGSLFIGLTLAVLTLALGAVSGAHVNPAVTFGLWASRRLKTVLLPFYWVAQFLGAILAVLVTSWLAHNSINMSFGRIFHMDWGIFGVELIATAVFLFGYTAVTTRRDISATARAVGVGLALMTGLLVGGSLLAAVKTQDVSDYQTAASAANNSSPQIPYSAYIKGVTANPAVALAQVDRTDSELTSGSSTAKETVYSYLSAEVILGTLVGAAVGANLYLLLVDRRTEQ